MVIRNDYSEVILEVFIFPFKVAQSYCIMFFVLLEA